MEFKWVLSIVVFIVVIGVSFREKKILEGIIEGCIIAIIGLVIMGVCTQEVDYTKIKDSLEVIVDENIVDKQLEDEIKNLVKDEIKNKNSDILISIESSEVNDVKIKRIGVEVRSPVIFKGLYVKNKNSFKLFIKKIDSGEYITQVVGI